jgi:CO/xanthine dehydrogenase FAD-binding subunit
MALDASVELAGSDSRRTVQVEDFVTGRRETARHADEMVTGLIVPEPAAPARSVFLKFGARRYMLISIVNVAALLEVTDGKVSAARIAVGACSPVARRLTGLETALAGHDLSPALGGVVTAQHLSTLDPVTDLRGRADYRMDTALTLVRRALEKLGS